MDTTITQHRAISEPLHQAYQYLRAANQCLTQALNQYPEQTLPADEWGQAHWEWIRDSLGYITGEVFEMRETLNQLDKLTLK